MPSHTIQAKPLRFRWCFLFPLTVSISRRALSGSFDTKKSLATLAFAQQRSAVFAGGTTAGQKGGQTFMRIKWDRALKKTLAVGAICLCSGRPICAGTEPWRHTPVQPSCPRPNRIATGRCVPQLYQLDRQRDRTRGRRWRGAGGHFRMALRPGPRPLVVSGRSIARGLRGDSIDRVLDHEWNRRCYLTKGE